MINKMFLLIVLALLFAGSLFTVNAAGVDYDNGFDSNTTGSLPPGFSSIAAIGTTISQVTSYSGRGNVYMQSADSDGVGPAIEYDIMPLTITEDYVTMTFDYSQEFTIPAADSLSGVGLVYNSKGAMIQFNSADQTISAFDNSVGDHVVIKVDMQSGAWYKIRVDIDFGANTYDVYLDDFTVPAAEGLELMPIGVANRFEYTTMDGTDAGATTVYLDNLKIESFSSPHDYKATRIVYSNDFEMNYISTVPPEFNVTADGVATLYSVINSTDDYHNIFLAACTSGLVSGDPIGSVNIDLPLVISEEFITVDFQVTTLSSSTTAECYAIVKYVYEGDTAAIYFDLDEGNLYAWDRSVIPYGTVLLGSFFQDVFYDVKLVINRAANTYDVYVDGTLLASDITLATHAYTPTPTLTVRVYADLGDFSSVIGLDKLLVTEAASAPAINPRTGDSSKPSFLIILSVFLAMLVIMFIYRKSNNSA